MARGDGLNCPHKKMSWTYVTFVELGVLLLHLGFGFNYEYLYVCAPAGGCRIEKRMLGFLELELQVVVRHPMDRLMESVCPNEIGFSARAMLLPAKPTLQPLCGVSEDVISLKSSG